MSKPLPKAKMKYPTFTKDESLSCLRSAASAMGEPLTVANYLAWRSAAKESAPSTQTLVSKFGSFSKACNEAGVKNNGDTRPKRGKNYTDEQIMDYLREFVKYSQLIVARCTVPKLSYWCTLDNTRPSGRTIYNRVRSWNETLESVARSIVDEEVSRT